MKYNWATFIFFGRILFEAYIFYKTNAVSIAVDRRVNTTIVEFNSFSIAYKSKSVSLILYSRITLYKITDVVRQNSNKPLSKKRDKSQRDNFISIILQILRRTKTPPFFTKIQVFIFSFKTQMYIQRTFGIVTVERFRKTASAYELFTIHPQCVPDGV